MVSGLWTCCSLGMSLDSFVQDHAKGYQWWHPARVRCCLFAPVKFIRSLVHRRWEVQAWIIRLTTVTATPWGLSPSYNVRRITDDSRAPQSSQREPVSLADAARHNERT
jgi:hypothetical protein